MPDPATNKPPGSSTHTDRALAPQVPDHKMVRRIGGGSYGEVWLARSVMGTYRAVKIVYRDSFDTERPFLREFNGIRKFEPISRSHESQVDILQVGKGEGYFYYVMELADDANAECGARSAEPALTRPAATLPHPMAAGGVEGSQAQLSTLSPQPLLDPQGYIPKTLGRELYQRGKLPFEECLRISLSLTTALEHLHRHGLVHRDIKPSNIIFVHGIPKLADIGLVTSIDATVSYVGTEGFLPPEGPGTPQGDIYSLGKVLYEICTGRDRQDFPELPTNLAELPEREGLLELNAIIAKACQNAPGARYQSATEMHADIVLLQSGKSVRRVRSLERRLARAIKIAVAIAALGGVMALAFVFQRHETRAARRLAEENRRLAAKSQQVAQFLTDMLKGVGPSVALGRDTTMLREILDKTAERIGKDLTNQPEVEIEVRLTLAKTYRELGLYKRAEEMARESLRLGRSRLSEDNPAIVDALGDLGNALGHLGRLDEAEIIAREALALSRKLFGQEHRHVADSLQNLGAALWRKDRLVEAEAVDREALSMNRKLSGKEAPETADSLNNLANVLEKQGQFAEAETMYRESLSVKRKLLGNEHPEVAVSLNNLAIVLNDQGKLPEAEAMQREALAMEKKFLGVEHPTVALFLNNLASDLQDQGKPAEAESLFRERLTILRARLPDDDPETGQS